MRRYPSFLLAILTANAALLNPEAATAQDDTAESILRSVVERMERLEAISFDHTLELNYASQDYRHTTSARGYVEFSGDNAVGARFRFENADVVYAYNGSESFFYEKNDNLLHVDVQPGPSDLVSRFFQGSFYALRRALPGLLDSGSAEFSLLGNEGLDPSFHHVDLRLPRATISHDGELFPLTTDIVVTYRLTIEKETMLPVEVTKIDPNGDYMRTTLSAVDLDPALPPHDTWYYSALVDEETRDMHEQPRKALVDVGQAAPAWGLNAYEDGREVGLRDFEGRNVLLIFWISHCGHSIAAVPVVNALQRDYAADGLAVVSINPHDAAGVIDQFVRTNAPEYLILEQGQDVAEAYGVPGYPVAVLVGRGGDVAYAGPVAEQALRELLRSTVQGTAP